MYLNGPPDTITIVVAIIMITIIIISMMIITLLLMVKITRCEPTPVSHDRYFWKLNPGFSVGGFSILI
jgi:hypothetical protein